MKYPITLLFRNAEYSYIDLFFQENKDNLLFSLTITDNPLDLNKLFDSTYHLLLTFGESEDMYLPVIDSILPERIKRRWVHLISSWSMTDKEISGLNKMPSVEYLNNIINKCYMDNIVDDHSETRVAFSLFTTCYKSYDKIIRAYNSIKEQTLKDWEWVILDDSPEDEHFPFLIKTLGNDRRVRLYKRSENSGSIGNVKNEAVMLCRGKYVIEMDHDDEILPDLLHDAANVFENNPDIGFVYTDFINLYENGDNFSYGDFFGLGYCGYYCQKYKNKWVNVAITPNINNTTLSKIVAVPNHPRIWRKSSLIEMGNYSEFLPIADDYELLLRTSVKTKMAKIAKFGYIQYMNNNNNNFSLIRNSEITRLCRHHLYPQCFEKYKINEKMKELGADEDAIFSDKYSQIWRRKNYEYKYCNEIFNADYKTQYCVIGLETFRQNKKELIELYQNKENDIILLDSKYKTERLTDYMDYLKLDGVKCYSLSDHSEEELVNYFLLLYKSCSDYSIFYPNPIVETVVVKNPTELLTIITPCTIPGNLKTIQESIDFNYVKEWIIVYDEKYVSSIPTNVFDKTDKIKEYICGDKGVNGNPQRNFALSVVQNQDTFLYFLDDDNLMHPDFYHFLSEIEPGKMYTFNQSRPETEFPFKPVLKGSTPQVQNIDTGMMLIDFQLCNDIRWINENGNADGFYINECYRRNIENWIFVDKILSFYKKLI